MDFLQDLKYSEEHEWIRIEGNIGTIGITNHAQSELGDIVYVEIEESEDLEKGEVFGSVEAVKTVADLFMPVGGKVIEKNEGLEDTPETVNEDPYGEGWLVKIEINNLAELDELMDLEAYRNYVGK